MFKRYYLCNHFNSQKVKDKKLCISKFAFNKIVKDSSSALLIKFQIKEMINLINTI